MESHVDPALLRSVGRALEGVETVRAAWVFGSRARGRARPDSDLDVAIALDPALRGHARHVEVLRVIEALTAELGALGERADVLDLDEAGSTIAFRAIRDGARALERSPEQTAAIVAWTARRYDDDAPRRALFRSAAVRAARGL